jgi:hypothetical protein
MRWKSGTPQAHDDHLDLVAVAPHPGLQVNTFADGNRAAPGGRAGRDQDCVARTRLGDHGLDIEWCVAAEATVVPASQTAPRASD